MADTKSRIIISAEVSQATRSLQSLGDAVDTLRDRLKKIPGIGATLGAGLSISSLALGIKSVIEASAEAEQSQLRLQAIYKATGASVGFTANELNRMADAMAASTQFDDESIRDGMGEIIKFGSITGKVFKDSLKVIADYAAFSGQAFPDAAAAVAKALADPETAAKLLKQAGVVLTESQKDLIKKLLETGDAAGAQNVILDQLKSTYGGIDDVLQTGLLRSTKELSKEWNELMEELGKTSVGPVKTSMNLLADMLRVIREEIARVDQEYKASLFFNNGRGVPLQLSTGGTTGPLAGKTIADVQAANAAVAKSQETTKAAAAAAAKKIKITDFFNRKDGGYWDEQDKIWKAHVEKMKQDFADQAKAAEEAQRIIFDIDPIAKYTAEWDKLNKLKVQGLLSEEQVAQAYMKNFDAGDKKSAEDAAKAQEMVAGLRKHYAAQNAEAGDSLRIIPEHVRALNQELRKVEDEAQKAREDLAKMTDLDPSVYAQKLDEVNETLAKQREEVIALNKQQQELNGTWQYGASKALQDYADQVGNVSVSTERMVTRAFGNMEDALVEFVRHGKLDFSSLADSIINDLIRIQIQQSITKPLAESMGSGGGFLNILGSFFGGGAGNGPVPDLAGSMSVNGFASGGMHSGGLRIVGERGPELEATGASRIWNAEQTRAMLGGSGGNSVRVEVINQSSQPVQASQVQPQFDASGTVVRIILEDISKNGPIAKSVMGLTGAQRRVSA